MKFPIENLFFSGCQMLSSCLGVYEDSLEQGFNLPRWKNYDDIIAWLIEYVSESRFTDFDKIGEIAEAYSSKLTTLVEKTQVKYKFQTKEADFVLLCLWMVAVLDRFAGLMRSRDLGETRAAAYYSNMESNFEELRQSIIVSANTKKEEFGIQAWSQLEQFAQELADQWLVQVYADSQ